MKISNVEYHESLRYLEGERSQSLIANVTKAMMTAFQGDSTFESIHVVGFRPGSLIVIFVLTFKRAVTEEQAIAILRKAADTGNLGSFEVDSSSITAISEKGFKSTPATTRPIPVEICTGCSCNCTILISIVGILVAIIIALIIYIIWLHRKGKQCLLR